MSAAVLSIALGAFLLAIALLAAAGELLGKENKS